MTASAADSGRKFEFTGLRGFFAQARWNDGLARSLMVSGQSVSKRNAHNAFPYFRFVIP